jgi:hypothetical protein
LVTEDNGKHDTAQVSSSTSDTGDDTVGVRVDVRHESEYRTVGSLEEESHAGNEAEHSALVVRVHDTDGDLEGPADNSKDVLPDLLAPDRSSLLVQEIGNQSTTRTENNVQKTEHGGPATSASLTKLGEVLEVVRAEDGVDSELSTERAEVAEGEHESLDRKDHVHSFLEGGLDDNFTLGSLQHFLLTHGNFAVEGPVLGLGKVGFFIQTLLGGASGGGVASILVSNCTWDSNEAIDADTMGLQVLLHSNLTIRPSASRCVFAEEEKGKSDNSDEDEGHDESHSPCNMVGQVSVVDQRIEDGRHDEVCNSTTCITPASCESIGCTDNILVKEPS